jgi:hypothetical protein
LRKLISALVAAGCFVAAAAVATPVSAASGGGCQLQGTASFSPGLSNSDQPFSYHFGGNLTGCQSTVAGSPAGGAVSAGNVETAATGEQFQEPMPTGSGSCASGSTSGTAIVTWADGTQTVIAYTTSAVGAGVVLQGTVVPSVTLQAINPQVGQPTSMTVTTTRYSGDTAKGELAFQADATQCAGVGVTSAGISGATELAGS